MRFHIVLTSIGVLFSSSLLAHESTKIPLSDKIITNRLSADHLKLPQFTEKSAPGFQLPPVEDYLIPKEQSHSVKILINKVEFAGNKVVSYQTLQDIAKPFINRPVSVSELDELRQKISQYYTDQGYINSGAVLPDQNVQNGVIRLQIIEGKLSEIRVTGTDRLKPDYVSDRLQRDKNQPLNTHQLQQQFQQLLLDPLIERMNGNLMPSTKRGESILEIAVTRALPYQLNFEANNYRPPSIGSDQQTLSGWVRNLTGFGDVVDAGIINSAGSTGGSGGFSIPLNAYDSRFSFHFDLNNAAVIEQPLRLADIKSEYLAYEFSVVQPLIQNLTRSFNLGIVLNIKKNKTFLLGQLFPFAEYTIDGLTRESVLRFRLDWSERFEKQLFSARSTTSVGINAFNATWHHDPNLVDSDFVSWLGQLQYAGQVFETGGTLILRADLQYSDDKLMSMERFSLGGRYSVRGYRENEIVTDKGYVLSSEFRYPLAGAQLTLFPFMDYGAGWNRGGLKQNLYSAGVGLQWQPNKYINTEIIYALALNSPSPKTDYNLQDSGVHWGLTLTAF